jgi:hypothetical protein
MKSKPRSFALTDEGFQALRSLEKHLPFLKRGKLVSLALQNMERDSFGLHPIKPVKLTHPDPEFLKFLDHGIWQLIELTRQLRDLLAQTENLDCGHLVMSCYTDALEELQAQRRRLENLAPLMVKITSADLQEIRKFLDISRAIESDPNSDPKVLSAYRIASRILEPLVKP